MFLVKDTLSKRQSQIRSYEPFVGVILAAADFEWTVRRAILGLGKSPTKHIRETVLKNCSGLDKYKRAWNLEVWPFVHKRLPAVIPDWLFFKKQAYPLRHRLVHGVAGTVTEDYAASRIESILNASKAITDFAESLNAPIYGRIIRRLKPR